MVKYSVAALDTVFSALGDGTRRAILARLAEGETSVGELAAPHEMSLPAISRHLRVLEKAGLVKRQREGRVVRCNLRLEPLKEAVDWIAPYESLWHGQLDRLARFLDDTSGGKEGDQGNE